MNSSQQRVTILIPTFNRSVYLSRQLRYLSEHFARDFYTIIVLDSSTADADITENAALCETYDVALQTYDSQTVSGYQKLIDGVTRSVMDYVSIVADDDYFNETAMRHHAKMLDEDADAVSAYGHIATFRLTPETGDRASSVRLAIDFDRNRPDYAMSHPIARIFHSMMERTRAAYYSLYRREILLSAFKGAEKYAVVPLIGTEGQPGAHMDPRCFYFGDLIVATLPLIQGKKLNSGLSSFAYQVGQSVDLGQQAKKNKLPPRTKPYLLPLDPEFEFTRRANIFIDGCLEAYEHADPNADLALLRDFFMQVTMAFFGAVALSAPLITNYNRTLDAFGASKDLQIPLDKALRSVSKRQPLATAPNSAASGPITDTSKTEDMIAAYQFVLNDLHVHSGVTDVQVVLKKSSEIEVSNKLFSRMRETPPG